MRVRPGAALARVEIDDSGPGVDPAVRDRIFDAYFTTKAEGTGLGLAVVQQIVDAHGGEIAVRSATGVFVRGWIVAMIGSG